MNWDGEVVNEKPAINDKQVRRLMAMTRAIRESDYLADYIHQIKAFLRDGSRDDALALWSDLSEEEQIALWVAPSFGGVFTTAERSALHHGE